MSVKNKFLSFLKTETILVAAFVLAVISCFLVPPDMGYTQYIDTHTLALLFSLMAVMAGFQKAGIFDKISSIILSHTGSQKGLSFVLVSLCFFGSMLITNDVALITFVPLGILVLKTAKMESSLPVVTLMTIAANLGSMLTPIGNPQNLYLYTLSGLSLWQFLQITAPYTILCAILLVVGVLGLPTQKGSLRIQMNQPTISLNHSILYFILFVLALFCVAGLLSVWILLAVVVVSVALLDRTVLKKVDYSLLATFAAFFVFIGNMGRMSAFHDFVQKIVLGNEQITAVVASQIISNVPAALLLSGFTHEWAQLIIGTNLGGLGTLIASMASLISYKQIASQYPHQKGRYLLIFSLWNIGFLAVLLIFSLLVLPFFFH